MKYVLLFFAGIALACEMVYAIRKRRFISLLACMYLAAQLTGYVVG